MSERRLQTETDAEPTILSSLKDASSLKAMTLNELNELAAEIRTALRRLSELRSVHFASNMGVVELTIALHSVFDFTKDRLIWDVGHQCYPHKLLTGRFDKIDLIRTRGGLSGYPNPNESPYDLFMTGHAGSSVGTALGLSCGDALMARLFASKEGDSSARSRCSIAVVGDGSFTSGPIFEALNHAGELQQKLIVVLNDNEMSICKRVGAFGRYLDHMRIAPGYLGAKWRLRQLLEKTPAYPFLARFKDALKAGLVGGALFEDFGFRYVGPIDGHNIATLRKYFTALKNYDAPILLHVLTEKGRGYYPAEANPSQYHSTSPAKIQKDKSVRVGAEQKTTSRFEKRFPFFRSSASRFNDETDLNLKAVSEAKQPFTFWVKDAILNAMRNDPKVCVIVAAMTQGNMLERAREEFPERFFDVGICEAHAVNFAAGLAKAGMRPIVDIYSGFMQRAYDQLFQETSLQNLPIVFSLDRAGLVGADGATHHGVFDLSYFRPFPNIELIAPGDALDVGAAFKYAFSRSNPVAIRYPKTSVDSIKRDVKPFGRGQAEVLREGKDGSFAVCGGGILQTALEVAEKLADVAQIDFGVINARFAKPIDAETILRPLREGKALVAVEENALIGGFGSAVLEAACDECVDARAMVRCGTPDRYVEHGSREEELKDAGLDAEGLKLAALRALERAKKLRTRLD